MANRKAGGARTLAIAFGLACLLVVGLCSGCWFGCGRHSRIGFALTHPPNLRASASNQASVASRNPLTHSFHLSSFWWS